MHIIWGYIWSLGFKLLDERQLWINVIFFAHIWSFAQRLEKKPLCALFANNIPYCSSFRFIVLLEHLVRPKTFMFKITDLCYPAHNKNQYCFCHISCTRVCHGWMNGKVRATPKRNLFVEQGKNDKTRADCQRTGSHSSAHLFKVCLVDVLLFGGKHMSTAAVPPWIGGDCGLANCIPGNQAKSEWSKLSHFWCEHSTWFTRLLFHKTSSHLHKPRYRRHLTYCRRSNSSQTSSVELCDIPSCK